MAEQECTDSVCEKKTECNTVYVLIKIFISDEFRSRKKITDKIQLTNTKGQSTYWRQVPLIPKLGTRHHIKKFSLKDMVRPAIRTI